MYVSSVLPCDTSAYPGVTAYGHTTITCLVTPSANQTVAAGNVLVVAGVDNVPSNVKSFLDLSPIVDSIAVDGSFDVLATATRGGDLLFINGRYFPSRDSLSVEGGLTVTVGNGADAAPCAVVESSFVELRDDGVPCSELDDGVLCLPRGLRRAWFECTIPPGQVCVCVCVCVVSVCCFCRCS